MNRTERLSVGYQQRLKINTNKKFRPHVQFCLVSSQNAVEIKKNDIKLSKHQAEELSVS